MYSNLPIQGLHNYNIYTNLKDIIRTYRIRLKQHLTELLNPLWKKQD